MNGPVIANRSVALYGGLALVAAGAWMLHDAYERRGRKRGYLASKLLP
jgi:hypothetical protein